MQCLYVSTEKVELKLLTEAIDDRRVVKLRLQIPYEARKDALHVYRVL